MPIAPLLTVIIVIIVVVVAAIGIGRRDRNPL
jgi:hypothetical protein